MPRRRRSRGRTTGASGATRAAQALTCALAWTTLAACTPPVHGDAYLAALATASRDDGAGRFAAATADYDEASKVALLASDRDEARWAAAETAARTRDVAGAAHRLEVIAADDSDEHQAQAAFRLALLRIDGGDADRGWQDLEDVPRRFPTHGVAHVAVRRLVEHADEKGPQAALDEARALRRDLEGTELAPIAAYLEAERIEAVGDDRAAREAYVSIAERWPYPFGAFFDDALWHASLADERLGRYSAAVLDLQRLLDQRETTTIMGTYERPRYVPSILREGELYRDRLHDRPRARDAFHRLYADFTNSVQRARGLWLEASLWREDGAAGTACDRLGTLVAKFPDSRYVPCAIEQCPALRRPPSSAAPAACHDYIRRTTPTTTGVAASDDEEPRGPGAD
jgi:tetratricopeptide (TPR) repeat protein